MSPIQFDVRDRKDHKNKAKAKAHAKAKAAQHSKRQDPTWQRLEAKYKQKRKARPLSLEAYKRHTQRIYPRFVEE